jgi:hypothetical protein
MAEMLQLGDSRIMAIDLIENGDRTAREVQGAFHARPSDIGAFGSLVQ